MAAAFRRARYPFENMTAPCAIEKTSTASKMFLVIQFDDASNDRLKTFNSARPKRARNFKAPKPQLNEYAINQEVMTRHTLIDDERTNLHMLLIARRSSRKVNSTIHSTL